ncbi:hypothetical protein SS50377_25976 [Spironucleus salmonicida]|uniref:Uncharacterized protein n=1 Tax=Spironucleus salmonicida TaxID=348837 RepID=V6LFG8_9EUKA|nr:hypothetical protein SS50377_25976 [Spironucleus salmonicida]|eukprot:EST43237.1 Hypothetical protein SS50377_17102 [Spironucleus salmonicida]
MTKTQSISEKAFPTIQMPYTNKQRTLARNQAINTTNISQNTSLLRCNRPNTRNNYLLQTAFKSLLYTIRHICSAWKPRNRRSSRLQQQLHLHQLSNWPLPIRYITYRKSQRRHYRTQRFHGNVICRIASNLCLLLSELERSDIMAYGSFLMP